MWYTEPMSASEIDRLTEAYAMARLAKEDATTAIAGAKAQCQAAQRELATEELDMLVALKRTRTGGPRVTDFAKAVATHRKAVRDLERAEENVEGTTEAEKIALDALVAAVSLGH